ncbi:MAG: hypothetical protein ACREV0_10950 [Burkholderiales bacterium]
MTRLTMLFLLFVAGTAPAYAYLDPGTGSMVLQAILGGIAGVVIAGKLYWGRVKDWISRLSGRH